MSMTLSVAALAVMVVFPMMRRNAEGTRVRLLRASACLAKPA